MEKSIRMPNLQAVHREVATTQAAEVLEQPEQQHPVVENIAVDNPVDDPTAAQQVAAAQAVQIPEQIEQQQRPATEGVVRENLEVDSFGDQDPSLGDSESIISTTTSIDSTQFHYAHGTRYHAYTSAQYVLPNNEQEMNRLEIQHQMWDISLDGRLNLAPLPNHTSHALDLGCGTGAWAIEFADAHPNCDVIGLDLSPIQPTEVPPNLSFLIGDACAEWTFSAPFDYIHTRAIGSGIKDWPPLLDRCFKNLKPGGWIELQEFHLPMACDDGTAANSAALKFTTIIVDALLQTGVDVSATNMEAMPKRLRDAGFTNMSEVHSKWPVGPWARGDREKKIGALFLKEQYNEENVARKIFLGILKYSESDFMKLVDDVRRDKMNRDMHMYMPIDIICAQKPFD